MATYEKKFTRPYEDGYKDKPDKTTPITSDILNMQDDAFEAIEEYLENIGTGLPDDVTIKNSLTVGGDCGNDVTGAHGLANGSWNSVSGTDSHAEGTHTTAGGQSSHSEGISTVASGAMSHAEGYETKASGTYQHVQGKYNVEDTEQRYAHIVGGGTSDTERKNIHTLDWNGNAEFAGDVRTGNGASLDELSEKSGSMTEDISAMKEDISTVNTELTSQGKAIGELASSKITKFYAGSQGDTTLNDSDSGKMQDMMLYGKSEQGQYSGKNLLNATLQTTTVNGVTCTANGDGTYTLKGTATADCNFFVVAETAIYEKRLTGCPDGGADSKYTLYALRTKTYDKDFTDRGSGVTASSNSGSDSFSIRIFVANGYVCNNLVFKPMLVDATKYPNATYDDFEPYVGGIPSPNPDYPQEIKSVVEPVVKVTGKNLLNPTLQTTTQNGVTCTANGDGTYTVNGTATADTTFRLASERYTNDEKLKLVGTPANSINARIILYTGSEYKADSDNGYTGNTISSPFIRVNSGTTANNLVFKPMVTTSLTATYDDFEPYTAQTVTLTGITLNAIPVSSGGNVTIEGQQYISDYVDVERGKIVRMVGEMSTKNTTWAERTNKATYYVSTITKFKEHSAILCKSFRTGNWDDADANTMGIGYQHYLFVGHDTFASLEECQAFFNANEITLYGILTSPTEESLPDELVEKLKALQTYYPQTNLFITSNQLDGYAIFNYPVSLAQGWNYVKQQIGDTRDYIYDMDLQMAQAYVNSEYAVALTELLEV